MDKLFATDQVLRVFSKEQYGDFYDEDLLPAINALDSVDFFRLSDMLRGALKDSTTLECQIGNEGVLNVFIILLHNVNWARYNKGLIDSLVSNGLIDNRATEKFCDYFCDLNNNTQKISWKDDCRCHMFYGIYGRGIIRFFPQYVYLFSPNEKEMAILAANRKQYYLPDIYEAVRVRWGMLNMKKLGFRYPAESVSPEEERIYTEEMLQKGYYKMTRFERFNSKIF